MDNFPDRYQTPNLNQDQINHLCSPITPKELEAVIKSPPPPPPKDQFYQVFKEVLIPILFKLLHKIETEVTLPNSFYEASIILLLKSHKDPAKKGNFRPISLMSIDAKILNKILATLI